MFVYLKSRSIGARRFISVLMLLLLVATTMTFAADKKKKKAPATNTQAIDFMKNLDISKIVWPAPPAITRVKYLNYFAGEKIDETAAKPVPGKKKASWMERVAGTQTEAEKKEAKPRFVLVEPYGLAVDSKNQLYVADQKVGAIFVFNTETREVELIRNGTHAHFGRIIGLTLDDADKLFVSDSQLRRILVLNPKHDVIGTIDKGLVNPAGLAIDNENRFLYVADLGLDQVLVYDADTLKLIRKIGTTGKNHELVTPGDFSKPSGVAVDRDGNLYVTDTMNDRVEIFDANGNFISTFGKNGDGPGYFARPKGIAIDADGHIWVADGMLDRLQVFNKKGQILTYMGGHGNLPGQFAALCGVTIDKNNRVFTSETYPGRVQEFLYITDAEAAKEKARRDAEMKKRPQKPETNNPTTKKQAPTEKPESSGAQ